MFDIRHHVQWCAMPRFSLVSVTIEGGVSRGVLVCRVSPSVRHHEFSGEIESSNDQIIERRNDEAIEGWNDGMIRLC